MSPHRTLPQELVDKIIDELGDAYWDLDHDKRSDHRIDACKALHACTLVSRGWTGRSRVHLFRAVKIRGDEDGLFLIPPKSLMLYIGRLKIHLGCQSYRLFPSPKLLKPFHTAPISYLGITEGVFTPDARACIVECIVALSPTLQTVIFKYCSLSLHLILDIVSAHPGLKRLHLLYCDLKPAGFDHPVTPRLGPKAPDLELGVFFKSALGNHDLAMEAVAQLPNQFRRLDFDHMESPGVIRAANALIKTNAESLSSLKVHMVYSIFRRSEDQPLLSLRGCFNLSELTLDMERTSSCIVTTSTNVLLTLDQTQRSRLECIKLVTGCVYRWFCKEARTQLAQAWEGLDIVLSELAKVVIGTGGKRLTFILVSAGGHKDECIPFGRKWLFDLLPRFHELGALRIEYEPSRFQHDSGYGCFCSHGLDCRNEDGVCAPRG